VDAVESTDHGILAAVQQAWTEAKGMLPQQDACCWQAQVRIHLKSNGTWWQTYPVHTSQGTLN
jgi:hypothetical protein